MTLVYGELVLYAKRFILLSMREYSKEEILKRATKWVNKEFTCEKCRGINWEPLEIGVQSAPKLDLFYISLMCLDCGHNQNTYPIRLKKFLKLTEKSKKGRD